MRPGGWSRQVLLPFAATRVGLLGVGVLALVLIGSVRDHFSNLVAHGPAPLPLEIWARWDSEWYLLISQHGYRLQSFLTGYSVAYRPEDSTGFFPLYPILIRVLSSTGLSPVASGVLISNVALLAALTLLRILVKEETDGGTAARSMWFLLAFPTSLFLSAVYSESLALFLILGAFLAARRGRWGWLAVCGFLCALTRPNGALVAVPLAWEVGERGGGWKGWSSLAAFPAGTAAFSLFCQITFGDPLAWAHRQARWRGPASGPWRAFVRFFENTPQLHGAHASVLEFVMAALFLLALLPLARRFRPSWAIYSLLSVCVPLCSTLWSFSRFAILVFPVFVLLGWAAKVGEEILPFYLSVSLPWGGLLMVFFACGWWAA